MAKRTAKLAAAAAIVGASAAWGCATQGVGTGELETAAHPKAAFGRLGPVAFQWKSDGPSATSGRITATFPDGESFSGEYRQHTRNLETFGSDWNKTEPGMYRPPNATFDPDPYFIEGTPTDHVLPQYSGRLLASLRAPDGTVMHCWFHLNRPHYGPAGGALGTCLLSNGEQVEEARLGQSPMVEPVPSPGSQRIAHRE